MATTRTKQQAIPTNRPAKKTQKSRQTRELLAALKMIDPRAAALIVLPTFAAGYCGSLALLVIVAAFLAGLYASNRDSVPTMQASAAEFAAWKVAANSAGIPLATFVKTSCNRFANEIAKNN